MSDDTTNVDPAFLYRAFDKEEYALQFINNGKFRFSLLENYKTIEDTQRRDETEGESRSYIKGELPVCGFDKKEDSPVTFLGLGTVPGLFNSWGKWMNPTYLLCTSGPKVDLSVFRKKFGSYIVKINAPLKLLADINSSNPVNSKMAFTRAKKCFLEKVYYSKDQIHVFDLDLINEVRLTYLQKHPNYNNEYEYRYIIITKPCANNENLESHLYFDLNQRLDYIELVKITG